MNFIENLNPIMIISPISALIGGVIGYFIRAKIDIRKEFTIKRKDEQWEVFKVISRKIDKFNDNLSYYFEELETHRLELSWEEYYSGPEFTLDFNERINDLEDYIHGKSHLNDKLYKLLKKYIKHFKSYNDGILSYWKEHGDIGMPADPKKFQKEMNAQYKGIKKVLNKALKS